jgi:DNA-binding NtrC family response regulator
MVTRVGGADSRSVLVVEDEPDVRRTLERMLRRESCEVTTAFDGEDAVAKLEKARPALVLTDLEMPRADGRRVVAAAVQRRVPVVVITGHATVAIAVELMRAGAASFLAKPVTPEALRNLLAEVLGSDAPPASMVGKHEVFHHVLGIIDAVADTNATVLIQGESGTGKEVVARAIHAASRRSGAPFIAVNCGAIPEPLLESELFGHARGAFTGATQARAGRFQLAEGGSLFLDEIGDMPLLFQVKLLRVIQERQYEVLGEGTTRSADVRIIAATHRDLAEMVKHGTFREDLYYRLNVIDVKLPPLRERPGDIPLLVEHFIASANERHGTHVEGAEPALLEALARYAWPGNIRELGNVVERMVIFQKRGCLEVGALTLETAKPGGAVAASTEGRTPVLPPEGIDLRATVAELEDSLIEQALARTSGNRNAASQLLGLNRTTLVEKLKRRRS